MAKIFLHLGAHKTATTFIQENLAARPCRAALRRQNCAVIWLGRDMPRVDTAFRKLRAGKSGREKKEKIIARFFRRVRNNPRDIFFTSERPIGMVNLSQSKGVFYPNIKENMRRFKNGLGDREITVGFAVRNLGDFVESSYTFLVGNGRSFSFQEYLGSVATERLSWTPVIEELVSAFGAENLRIWKYEDFKKSPVASLAKIVEAAGFDASKLPPPVPEPKNVSIPRQTLPIALEWNKLCDNSNLKSREKRVLRKEMRILLAKTPPISGTVPLLSGEMRAELTQRYETEMDAIFQKWPAAKLALG